MNFHKGLSNNHSQTVVNLQHGPKSVQKEAINIETRRSTTPEKRVILVQGPC